MQPPQLSSYQQAATSIYEPQRQAEEMQLATVHDTTKNALEAQKGQVNTTYQDAINKLSQTLQDQTGQLNLLYSQRLGGNFSGLQGNDLGNLYSRANQQQGIIEQTRANKLNEITTGETNSDIVYESSKAALKPKYQSLENEYSNSAYGSAVKDYNSYQQQQFDNQIKLQNLSLAQQRASQGSQPNAAAQKQSDMGTIAKALTNKAGKDGHVSQETWNAAIAQWTAAGYSASEFVKNNMQYVNQRYKGYHGFN